MRWPIPIRALTCPRAGQGDRSWRTYEVPCGHDVMVDMPERLWGTPLAEVA